MSVTPDDEARYLAERYQDRLAADALDRRMSRIPIRERLTIWRQADQPGGDLVALVDAWEREHPEHPGG